MHCVLFTQLHPLVHMAKEDKNQQFCAVEFSPIILYHNIILRQFHTHSHDIDFNRGQEMNDAFN